MNGELRFDDVHLALDARPQRFLRIAVLLSISLHVVGFLTSPFWQSRPVATEEVMQVDIADVPPQELPKIPTPIVLPPAPKVAPRPPVTEASRAASEPLAPPTREMIREKIATQGLLKTLSARKAGEAPGDLLAGIRIPKDIPISPRAAATSYPAAHDDEPGTGSRKTPGIGTQVASAARSPRTLASQVFRTDAGLEGSISGGIDDESRTTGAIAATISQYRSGIRYAYNRELLKNPTLSGKITVAFVILPNGSVDSAEVRQSSVGWPPLEDAVIKRLRLWKFPRSKGATVQVVFPFVFHPEM